MGKRLIPGVLILAGIAIITVCLLLLFSQLRSKKEEENIPAGLSGWDPIKWSTIRNNPISSLGSHGEDVFSYRPFIKNPDLIGYEPKDVLFLTILNFIKSNYVNVISDMTLIKGCEREVGNLLRDAGLKITPYFTNYDIHKGFIEKITGEYGKFVGQELIVFASIRGLLRSLDDTHSYLIAGNDYKTFESRLKKFGYGNMSGLGIVIEFDRYNSNCLTVMDVIPHSPACDNGIVPGDVLESINNEKACHMPVETATIRLRGKDDGSPVQIALSRNGKVKHYTMKPEQGDLPLIQSKILEGGIGYIRIQRLRKGLIQELDQTLYHFSEKQISSLILDLRCSGFAFRDYSSMANITSRFVPPGRIIFTRIRKGSPTNYKSTSRNQPGVPLVVLVNRFSSRFSEIIVGAVSDNGAGFVIGERTQGIGSHQEIYPLEDGSALKLTESYFITSKGRSIEKKGLKPDLTVTMDPQYIGTDSDSQMEEAKSYLLKHKRE